MQLGFSELFLNHVCVPLFFAISGCLFFLRQPEKADLRWFVEKWKSRFWSLLIPYVIANTIFNLGWVIIALVSGMGIDVGTLLKGYWVLDHSFPVDLPTWFLRDLMIAVALSPIIFVCIRKTSVLLPILLGVMWVADEYIGIGMSLWKPRAYFFFALGSWFGIKQIDFVKLVKTGWLMAAYVLIYSGVVLLYLVFKFDWMINMSVLLGFPVLISLAKMIAKRMQNPISPRMVAMTFFIFLYHYYFAVLLWRVICLIIGTSELSLFVAFIGGAVLTVLGLAVLYCILERICPRFLGLMVGGRR